MNFTPSQVFKLLLSF